MGTINPRLAAPLPGVSVAILPALVFLQGQLFPVDTWVSNHSFYPSIKSIQKVRGIHWTPYLHPRASIPQGYQMTNQSFPRILHPSRGDTSMALAGGVTPGGQIVPLCHSLVTLSTMAGMGVCRGTLSPMTGNGRPPDAWLTSRPAVWPGPGCSLYPRFLSKVKEHWKALFWEVVLNLCGPLAGLERQGRLSGSLLASLVVWVFEQRIQIRLGLLTFNLDILSHLNV